jgi:Lrp/AsnC family transcriptional regulator of ectoine degradation
VDAGQTGSLLKGIDLFGPGLAMPPGRIKLDDRDIKILTILQSEGRIPKATLAERVNLSPTPCWERLNRLEIVECFSVSGGFDYLCKFVTRDLASYQAIIDRLLSNGSGVKRYFSYPVMTSIKKAPIPIQMIADTAR